MSNSGASTILELIDLTAGYGNLPILTAVSAAVPAGARVGVVGPNGAGKSTLFKTIIGQLPLLAGTVLVHGQPVESQISRIAYVPQREQVDWRFPVTVLDVVLMGRYGKLGWLRRPGNDDRRIAMHCLIQVGMEHLAQRSISELSGGQQQRLFLARALSQEPGILVLDEPFAGIDATAKQSVMAVLADLQARGMVILLSTHDLTLAAQWFDYVMLINRGLIGFGSPDQVLTASNLASAFGEQLLIYKDNGRVLMVTDHCCPCASNEASEETKGRR